ncbi:RNA-binding protein [Apiospora arundinis]|uniref:Pentatricopeptide repeat protein n=1 Tax=Apiospora arundinis TaxID=335852 RepID=A0ABR2J572_9PEZI
MGKQVAADFQKIVQEGRERKKNEALAAKIFGKDGRRQSAPLKATTGGSLASRAGVKKRVSSVARLPAGNINGEWIHDLHGSRSTPNLRAAAQNQPKPNSLAARLHAPGTKAPAATQAGGRNTRASKVANAFSRSLNSPAAAAQMNIQSAAPAAPRGGGLTIRGLAGPYAVLAQNFAPGTTAADIESAMTPVGGLVSSCKIIKTHPLVIAEIVFESREGAEQAIATFNNQTADGRILHVYMKPGGGPSIPTGPRNSGLRHQESRPGNNNVVIDGTNGFDDMDTSDAGYSDGSGSAKGLYSDRLVPNGNGNNSNRRGRGFSSRGRNGR